jgi:predicted metalloprotease with PDZ domain
MGQALWVYPDMPESSPLQLSLHWKNIPDGWALINSFGVSKSRQKVNTTLESFRKGTFLAGDYRIKTIIINKEPVYAVTRGTCGFADEEFHKLVKQIFQVERDFWKTRGFLTTMWRCYRQMIPREDRGGEGRTNSFTLYVPKDFDHLSKHRRTLAHELFHEWNPRRLGRLRANRRRRRRAFVLVQRRLH